MVFDSTSTITIYRIINNNVAEVNGYFNVMTHYIVRIRLVWESTICFLHNHQ